MKDSFATRAVIVASTTSDLDDVCVRVQLKGGIVFPARKSIDGLLPMVRGAVQRALQVVTDVDWTRWSASAEARQRLGAVYSFAYTRDIVRAIANVKMHSSDLDVAQQTLTMLDRVVNAYGDLSITHRESRRDLASFVDTVARELSDLPEPQHAIAVLEAAIGAYRRIIDLQSTPQYRVYRSAILHDPGSIGARNEFVDALAWAYRHLEDT
jgi:hypothetical protein